MGGHLSRAQYNPAVAVGVFLDMVAYRMAVAEGKSK